MKNPPKISVIMPVYNSEVFIKKAIESVISQTFTDFEFIVVDDGSIDNTENIIKNFKDLRIKYNKIPHSGCPAIPRNFGINRSKGKYIAFLDSDDAWHNQKLERQLPHLQIPKIIGVASNAIFIAETQYYRKINLARSRLGYVDYQYSDILNHSPIITSSLIVKKEILKHTGLFDENRDFCFIEDWELWLRMTRYGLFRILEKPLLSYRVSRKRGFQATIISKNCLKILEKQIRLCYVKDNDIVEPKASVYLSIARNLLEFDQRQSRKYYIEALKTTSIMSRKLKSCIGILISFSPLFLRRIIFLILYKVERILSELRDYLRIIIKIFY